MERDELFDLGLARRLAASGQARSLRVAAGLTQAELARAVKVRASVVNHVEAGRRRPTNDWGSRYGALLRALLKDLK